jgi:SAM-dependent methyltransferase
MQQSKLDNYASARGAGAYKADWQAKVHRRLSNRREQRIFAALFAEIGTSATLLDLPCGHGRLFELLSDRSERVIEADWSQSMLRLNAADHAAAAAGYLRCSALAIPLPDRAVDSVVSVRLSHHFDRFEEREQHLREVFRVADRFALLTYFSHRSVKNLLRRLRAPFNRKAPKNTLLSRRVRAIAAECGFAQRRALPLSRLSSGHVFALFARADADRAPAGARAERYRWQAPAAS